MPPENDCNIFVGDSNGNLKGFRSDVTNVQKYKGPGEGPVTALAWTDEKETDLLMACGTKEIQRVHIFDTETSIFTHSFGCNKGEGKIVGVCNYYNAILATRHSGHVICPKSEEEDWLIANAGPNLHRMRQSNTEKKIIATGGLENPLKLFDVEKKKQIFVAKNIKNDSLQLRVPVWISDIGFFPGSSKLITASKYGYVRLYDTLVQRRPVLNVEVKLEALGSCAVHPSKMQVIVGSGKGIMNLIDLRNGGKILNSYKGAAGSITAIAINKTGSNVISVGLDRVLRVHDVNTKQLLKKQYLTSRSTSLLIRAEFASAWTENRSL